MKYWLMTKYGSISGSHTKDEAEQERIRILGLKQTCGIKPQYEHDEIWLVTSEKKPRGMYEIPYPSNILYKKRILVATYTDGGYEPTKNIVQCYLTDSNIDDQQIYKNYGIVLQSKRDEAMRKSINVTINGKLKKSIENKLLKDNSFKKYLDSNFTKVDFVELEC